MSVRSPIRVDDAFKKDLEMYEIENGIKAPKHQNPVNYFFEAYDRGLILELTRRLCNEEYTGVFEIDIVKAAFYANKLAHLGNRRFFSVKSRLLEYIFENQIWGEEPYNSYGIGEDENSRPVAYFDVPGYGQVSFHLVDVNYDKDKVPKYEMEWCKTINFHFPSYSSIISFHDLILALGYPNHGDLGEAVEAITPIDFRALDYHISSYAYFVDLSDFYYEVSNRDKEDLNFEHLLNIVGIREVKFSKENRIDNERFIHNREEKIKILKKCKDKEVQKLLREIDYER